MKNLFAIDSQYPMIANVKNHLVFINQDHTLRYDLVANKVNKLVNNDKHRHLCFFKTPEGDELELLEINKFLYIKTKAGNVIAYQEPIDIGVTNGALAMSNLHEYATGLDLKVLIVAFLVANYYSVVVLDWQTQAFLCEFKVVIGSDVKAADFYFENIFADSSDIRYIKGTMIENEKVVYDLTLVQLSSVKTRQSDDFQDTFLDLFKKQDIPISNQVIQRFQVFDVTAPEPRTLAQFHNNFQIPLVDRLIKEGRVSLIENALKFKKGRLHSIGTELAFKNTHHFVSTVILPLITNKEEELRQFIHNHFKQAASTAEELNQLKDQRLENHLITYIAYLTDLDRVRAAHRRSL